MRDKIITILLISILYIPTVQKSHAQWVLLNNGIGNSGITSLTSNLNYIFAGTPGSGVFISSNSGATWTQTPLNNQDVRSLTANGNNIYAGSFSGNGVFKSSDNGTSWTQTSLNNKTIRSLRVSGSNVYAGAWTPSIGMYKSTDEGATWTLTSLDYQLVRSMAVNGNNVYAGSGTVPGGDGVFLSQNNGEVWSQSSLNYDYIGSLAADGNNVFAGSGYRHGLYVSTDNGISWAQSSLDSVNVYSLAIYGNNIYAGTYDYGVYVSNDYGTTWTKRNDGLSVGGSMQYDLCIFNNYIFAGVGFGGTMGVYRRPLSQLTNINSVSNEIPNEFSLSQNYPNPFNPVTKITFSIPTTQNISIKVYDELGKEVDILVNEQLNPGKYEAVWSANRFSSGIYYYKLTAGNFSQTNKMILLK